MATVNWLRSKLFFLLILGILFYLAMVRAAVCPNGDIRDCGTSNIGECSYGTQTCNNGQWGICLGAAEPKDEVCNDNKDNNCDGKVDDGCVCNDGGIRKCGTTDLGICELGEQTCQDNKWGSCYGAVEPGNESCNGLDDDCDSKVDEDCVVGSCFDNLQNQNEQGIDCGGPCPACATCQDNVKNQGEEGIDCGGPCPKCSSCEDGIKNQNEQDIDCGGVCEPCEKKQDRDKDKDGLTYSQELEKGTDPKKEDSDNDGILDGKDDLPLCPNNFCDVNFKENTENCPQDCKKGIGFPLFSILIIFLLTGLGFYAYLHYKKKISNVKENKQQAIDRFKYKR